ncbi:MAG TPA: zinc ABC transporter substrate-binding protein [Gammaproteobacteria bacterium]|nr:zinc ABC transporter substrate-binding protein [Gammaproteobacteria bacterium]
MRYLILTALLFTLPAPARAALDVFACEPEWGALVGELAGDQAEIYVATTGRQDIHQIQARPSLIARARRADLVVCTGAELEIAWLPMVLRQAGNGRVQPGQPGYFEAARFVDMLEIPASVDRALGDIHPFGNPHIQTDPRNIARVAEALAARLAELDPANAAFYAARHAAFKARWEAALARWAARAAPLRGMRLVAHHKSWPYLEAWLGIEIVGYLEPKPGIPPSSAHLATLLKQIEGRPVQGVIRSGYEDPRPSEWFAQRAGVPAVVLPQTVGATPEAQDLFALYDAIVTTLLELTT